MIFPVLIAALLIGGLALSYCSIRHMFDDIKRPPVDPAPDAFPLHYRSPYVSGYRHVQYDHEGRLIAGYQPAQEPPHSEPPQGGSVTGRPLYGYQPPEPDTYANVVWCEPDVVEALQCCGYQCEQAYGKWYVITPTPNRSEPIPLPDGRYLSWVGTELEIGTKPQKERHALLNRPLNPALDIVYNAPQGGQSNRALLSLMQKIEREIAKRTGEPVVGDLAKSIGRYYVAEQCYESAPSPTSEQEGTMSMECEVDYE